MCYQETGTVSQLKIGLVEKYGEPTDCSVLKDNQEARIIDPLDLKPSTDVFPLYKSGLDIPRLQLLREAGERKNACDAGRELGE